MSSSFIDLGVPAVLATRLAELEILEPYPIQAAALPEALQGLDICAQSPTGSGKTLAFALPIAARVSRAQPRRPRALVLAPTRELAAQIAKELGPLAAVMGRRVATYYGGVGFKEQLSSLARGTDIAVGCPGRMIDLLERRSLDLSEVEIVVIDEADRMADMGFLPPVRRLLGEIRGAHQTMLFSATLAGDVQRLIRDYQKSPRRHVLDAATDDIGSRSHEFWRASREDRATLTARLVTPYYSSIVFCRTKRGVDRLTRQLGQAGLIAVPIHGDRSQAQRDRALAQFRDRSAQVLVGTDVAARGIHVDEVDCVVHYDPPEDEDTYIHRSGRTGRAGLAGRVVSLVTSEQETASKKLRQRLNLATSLIDAPPADPSARAPQRPVQAVAPRHQGPAPSHSAAPYSGGAPGPRSAASRRRRRGPAPVGRVGAATARPRQNSSPRGGGGRGQGR
ncbi:MAG TPA: DEAD/DEAH box helicase [Acidimicrobiales bacterium]|nr:DEAD/DEAH box helicase [Acidimicrobiales bacterium]